MRRLFGIMKNHLKSDQKTLPANHPLLATSYNNIGAVYMNMGEYSKALSFYEKALEISKKLFLQIILLLALPTATSVRCMKHGRVLESTF